ncbi:MAG: hypothetical protein WC612_03005 [Bdellovibrionales bacterium]
MIFLALTLFVVTHAISIAVIPAKAGIQSAAPHQVRGRLAACMTLMPRGRAAMDPAFQRDDGKGWGLA